MFSSKSDIKPKCYQNINPTVENDCEYIDWIFIIIKIKKKKKILIFIKKSPKQYVNYNYKRKLINENTVYDINNIIPITQYNRHWNY